MRGALVRSLYELASSLKEDQEHVLRKDYCENRHDCAKGEQETRLQIRDKKRNTDDPHRDCVEPVVVRISMRQVPHREV